MYRALIADDNVAICEGLRVLLDWNAHGFDMPDTARNGAEALKMLLRGNYQFLLTDVRMPVMDGIALLKEISEREMNVQSVILSGYRDFEYAQHALEYGAFRYLLKPVDEDQLAQCVDAIRSRLERMAVEEPEPTDDAFARALSYLDEHVLEKISLKRLAREFHFNPAYLGRLFLKRTGTNFHDYVSGRRARVAAKLLAQGMPVAEAADKVGYADVDYFGRVFKRQFGETPSEYRARLRK